MFTRNLLGQPTYYSFGSFNQNATAENRPVVEIPSYPNSGPSWPLGLLPVTATTPVPIEPDLNQPRKSGLGKDLVIRMDLDEEGSESASP